jgi:dTDP-4-dehydrorhamnose 3,5-epimerase
MTLANVQVFIPEAFNDERGSLWTVWNEKEFIPKLKFNHDKIAISHKNVLRGIHGDFKSWKLITCLSGEIKLVVVDPKKLEYTSFILNPRNRILVLIPPGLGNGHLVLSKEATFYYKWAYGGEYPDVKDQFSLRWNDPKLKIEWGIENPILSERDKISKLL